MVVDAPTMTSNRPNSRGEMYLTVSFTRTTPTAMPRPMPPLCTPKPLETQSDPVDVFGLPLGSMLPPLSMLKPPSMTKCAL
ncbi:hypothetical protein CDO46_27295 [Pigmentiphaga sp. NML030171]|nr:hypothetical protein CDO46_27295 [Pigmentiphaga sp. NML030171]